MWRHGRGALVGVAAIAVWLLAPALLTRTSDRLRAGHRRRRRFPRGPGELDLRDRRGQEERPDDPARAAVRRSPPASRDAVLLPCPARRAARRPKRRPPLSRAVLRRVVR